MTCAPPDCTLTTACFDLSKYNAGSRPLSESVKNMAALLEVPCYLVVYTDAILEPYIRSMRGAKHDAITRYVIMNVETLDTFRFVDKVKSNRKAYHPTKDARTCAESHLVCCSKFELVLRTMRDDPFRTSKFGWIDANVGPNFAKICTNYKNNMLLRCLARCNASQFHLQILNVCDKKYTKEENLREYYSRYQWLVCGCLFVTGKEVGALILEELVRTFERHTELGYGHGEEMFYLGVLERYRNNIRRSFGDYNTILNNFTEIREGIPYILNIAKRYCDYGYHEECVECCDAVLKEWDEFNLPMDYGLYFGFSFTKYLALYYLDREKAKRFVRRLFEKMEWLPLLKEEYMKNEEFHRKQFQYVM